LTIINCTASAQFLLNTFVIFENWDHKVYQALFTTQVLYFYSNIQTDLATGRGKNSVSMENTCFCVVHTLTILLIIKYSGGPVVRILTWSKYIRSSNHTNFPQNGVPDTGVGKGCDIRKLQMKLFIKCHKLCTIAKL
jgi:hypothetical protein